MPHQFIGKRKINMEHKEELTDFGYRTLYICDNPHDCDMNYNSHQTNLQPQSYVCTICYHDSLVPLSKIEEYDSTWPPSNINKEESR